MNGNFKNLFSALAAPQTGRWHRPSSLPKEFLNVWQKQTLRPGALQASTVPWVSGLLMSDPSPGGSPRTLGPSPRQPRRDARPEQLRARTHLGHARSPSPDWGSRDGSSPKTNSHQQNRITGDCHTHKCLKSQSCKHTGDGDQEKFQFTWAIVFSYCPCQMKPIPPVPMRKGWCRHDSVNSQ